MQKQISDILSWNHIVHWRQNSGAMRSRHVGKTGIVKEYFTKFVFMLYPAERMKFSDIAGILPDGRFLAIEVKKKGERPDAKQERYLQMVKDTNGVAFWADCLETVEEELSGYIQYHP